MEIDALAGCGFLVFWVGTATWKRYERKMKEDKSKMTGKTNLEKQIKENERRQHFVEAIPPCAMVLKRIPCQSKAVRCKRNGKP